MKIAYFSPLNPQRSGISDYSEELLPHLAGSAEIDLFVDGFWPLNKSLGSAHRCFDYQNRPEDLKRLPDYDAILYHMGNDHRYHAGIYQTARAFPGIVVLHDFALQNFFKGLAETSTNMSHYYDELNACSDSELRSSGVVTREPLMISATHSEPLRYPLNCRIARNAEALIVHSEWSRSRLSFIAPAVPIAHINLPVLPQNQHKESMPLLPNKGRGVELASFGHITTEKGIERTLKVLSTLRKKYQFHYTLVGQSDSFDVVQIVRSYKLTDRVTITGYVSMDEFERRIAGTDVAINLRDRTVGETSASVCRIMAAGVPCIVSNVAWFAELPDEVAIKVETGAKADESLREQLRRLMEDATLRQRIGANAQHYMRQEHAIEKSAKSYLDFIRTVIAQRARRRFIRRVSTELAHLQTIQSNEIFLRGVASEIAGLTPAKIFAIKEIL
jgi:glycosyltransferase involved in cell wall biosynthesis